MHSTTRGLRHKGVPGTGPGHVPGTKGGEPPTSCLAAQASAPDRPAFQRCLAPMRTLRQHATARTWCSPPPQTAGRCALRGRRGPQSRAGHAVGRENGWLTRTCAAGPHLLHSSATAVTPSQTCSIQLPHPAALSPLREGTRHVPSSLRCSEERTAHHQTRQSSCAARRRPPRRRRPAAGSCSRWCACPPCMRARLRAARPMTLCTHAPGMRQSPWFVVQSRQTPRGACRRRAGPPGKLCDTHTPSMQHAPGCYATARSARQDALHFKKVPHDELAASPEWLTQL
jgi:hypothetical protein